jgi:hypothetical protein
MNNEELFIIMGFFIAIFSILSLLRYFIVKNSASASYITKRRWKNINWKKVFKYWAICQGFMILSRIGEIWENINLIIFVPILVTAFLIFYYITENVGPVKEYGEEQILDQKDFENYEKAFNRQKKIDKIIKRF